MMEKLLIVDDDTSFLNDVESLLRDSYSIVKANCGKKSLEHLKVHTVDAVLLDLHMPDMSGLEVLKFIHEDIDPYLPVIIVTDHSQSENAVNAMRNGAYDFIPKGFNRDVLAAKIFKALERRKLEMEAQLLRDGYAASHDKFVFASAIMKSVHLQISKLANVNENVLLVGDTGVGKDVIAFEIHNRSSRRARPFVDVSIKAYNETLIESELFGHEKGAFTGADKVRIGKFEAANGGTIYIPEISTLGENVQTKLLKFMQYKSFERVGLDARKPEIKVDVRIIMATNENLEKLVEEGEMRSDFYFRIVQNKVAIPPLRERVDEIEVLAKYFIGKHCGLTGGEQCTLPAESLELLKGYKWPGNVRELEGMIKTAMIYSEDGILSPKCFTGLQNKLNDGVDSSGLHSLLGPKFPKWRVADLSFKKAYYSELLQLSDGNITKAAKLAGMSPQGLRKTLKQLGMTSAGNGIMGR